MVTWSTKRVVLEIDGYNTGVPIADYGGRHSHIIPFRNPPANFLGLSSVPCFAFFLDSESCGQDAEPISLEM